VCQNKSDAYSAEQVLLNKRQIYGGIPKLDCYLCLSSWWLQGCGNCLLLNYETTKFNTDSAVFPTKWRINNLQDP